ncbi:MAG TPA: BrnT family toxin [Thermotogota bacterium]|nr:BrnT family toxin [Thermotogota bacterium]
MKIFNWNDEKNNKLLVTRGITFGDIVDALVEKNLLEIVAHPNQERYPNQKIFVVWVRDYCYLVPFIETEEEIFLKTIIPSRKYTKKYLKGGQDE